MSNLTYRDVAYSLTDARLQIIQLAKQVDEDGDSAAADVLRDEQRRLASFIHQMEGRILAALSPQVGERR
ncbi:hypothetical protein [Salinicola socius]|uniref:Uncharacterized protein n=1 Tax=Salinicola socius TaxID=404433 RepID=A0A1Q8SUF4_9GAMM|nr:hypothetical protein [Salinicola socius]OLO05085.1 hypothetical protein BTW07_05585 [Salinicola socius]